MTFDAFRRAALFVMGLAIMGYETVFEHADRPWLIAAALGMLGLPIARSLESALTRVSPPAASKDGKE